ncbi:hypothetical protein THOM_1791 [Trachipleistophora hominis]|uniref:Uncharacterized protein n=1 Tax=Trachipleistophora hominis TaxID=72359 RepID=L7JV47_TRAHO|nr:hypothetical protein THOM_1791 [Trachipleistophora hominis]
MYDLYANFPELLSFKPEIEGLSSSARDMIKKVVLTVHRRTNYYHFNYEKVKEENRNLWIQINNLKNENIRLLSKIEAVKRDGSAGLDDKHGDIRNEDAVAVPCGNGKTGNDRNAEYFTDEECIYDKGQDRVMIVTNDNEQDGNIEVKDVLGAQADNTCRSKRNEQGVSTNKRVSIGESNDSIHNKSIENNFLDSRASQDEGSFNTSFFSNPLTVINLQNTIYQLNRENNLLKEKNERLCREISFVLDDGMVNRAKKTVDQYVNDYYDVVGLLKNMCRLNDSLKNENIKVKASLILERKDRENMVSEHKKTLSEQIARLTRENTELVIVNERLSNELASAMDRCKLFERSNEECLNKCRFMEVENYDLKFKNNIYEGLERKLDEKNFELQTYEYRLGEKDKEIERLRERLKDKDDKIHSMLVKKPFRQVVLDYKQVFGELRENARGMTIKIREILALVEKMDEMSKTERANMRSIAESKEKLAAMYKDKADESLNRMERSDEQLRRCNERIRIMTVEIENLKKDEADAINKLNEVHEENANLKTKIDGLLVQKNTFVKNNQSQIMKLLEIERRENEKELQKYKKIAEDVDLGKIVNVKTLMKQLEESKNAVSSLENEKKNVNERFNQERARIEEYYTQELQNARAAIEDLNAKQQIYVTGFEKIRELLQNSLNTQVCDFEQLREVIVGLTERCNKLDDELKTKERSIENFKGIILKLRSVNEKMLKKIKE